jgi:aspartyl-tRNA(Asn)/glutamyl-tRNA(Gln) amidotransferase subunit B
MQEGSFRCDVNISRRPQGSTTLGVRTELKNLNSFKFIEKAIHYEEWRQQEAIENGLSLQQETRLFCPHTQKTKPLRSKENAQDYRYFPDPDLLPIVISEEEIRLYQKMLPPLPSAIRAKLAAEEMGEEDLHFLLSHPSIYQYFTAVQSQTDANSKIIINWLRGPLQTLLQQEQYSFENIPIAASELALLLDALWQKTLSYHDAKELLTTHWQKKQSIQALLQTLPRKETEVVSKVIQAVLEEYPAQQQQYKEGKEKLLAFFVGQVLKRLPTKVDPTFIQQALKEKLA